MERCRAMLLQVQVLQQPGEMMRALFRASAAHAGDEWDMLENGCRGWGLGFGQAHARLLS